MQQGLKRSRFIARPGRQRLAVVGGQPLCFHVRAGFAELAIQPGAESGNRRQRGEGLEVLELTGQFIHHPLDQEVAKADAAQAFLGVGDGVENGGVGLSGIEHRRRFIQQGLHVVGDAVNQRHLDDDQRFVRHARMEKGEAAPVGAEPVFQIAPVLDGMHRLVSKQLFQQRSWRIPGNTPQFQEADIEPGSQQ